MDNKVTEKICGNCKNYFQHYGYVGGRFKKIEFGHCKAVNSKTVFKRGMENKSACVHWESNERIEEEKSKATKKRITNLIALLEQLANYIEEE